MKRTFIAIKIPVAKSTAELIHDIKFALRDDQIKWVDTRNMHITLFFLGDTDENLINDISVALSEGLKDYKKFSLKCYGLGLFKNMHNPTTLWFGIEESEYLQEIKLKVDEIIERFSFKIDERKFKPHLTLGRIKKLKRKDQLKYLLDKYKDVNIQDFEINEVLFYESTLTPKGPIYTVIKKIPLS